MNEKIIKAISIIQDEGYEITHKMTLFYVRQSNSIELNDVKSSVKLSANEKFNKDDTIDVRFTVHICKMYGHDTPVCETRAIGEYLLHLCDIADALNALELRVTRDEALRLVEMEAALNK